MKLTNKITAAVVLTFITVFSVLTAVFSAKDGFSDFPEVSLRGLANGTFGRELNSCAAKNFAGRDAFLSANARIGSGFCESIVNGVYISGERLLCVEENSSDSADVRRFNDFAAGYDGVAYFAAVPTSAGIYGDSLPPYLRTSTEKQQIDALYGRLSPDIRKIDAYSILKMLSDNYIYYRSDRKWTSYGAYCVYRTVIQKLGFLPVSYDKYTIRHVSDDFRGDLYEQSLYMRSKPDLLDIYEYPKGAQVVGCVGYDDAGNEHPCSLYDESAEGYGLYMGSGLPVVKISTTVNNDRKLLVVGDGYAACFIPFLTQHYSSVTAVFPQYTDVPVEELVDTSEYAQTLFIFGINTLNGGEKE